MRWSERRTAVRLRLRRLPYFHFERRAVSSAVAHLVLVRSMDIRPLKRFLAAAVAVGAIAPIATLAALYFGYNVYDSAWFWAWPSSLMLMLNNGREHLDIFSVVVVVISIITNMMLYFIAGFVVWEIYRAVRGCVVHFTNKT
jgi:hypothetical protein